ncbi:hypothetical protein [Diaphorobacter ruginosibacter]|uniref:hypothetical protein n=1 Tax=Diaphorobacter ruginosibacter TaxID=1715720 RepID=UPI003342B29C
MQISVRAFFRMFAAMLLALFSAVALANPDAAHRDAQALRGVKALVLLAPEFDEKTGAAGITQAVVARRAEVYLRGVDVRLVRDAATLTPAQRAESPLLLIAFGASRERDSRRTHLQVTVSVLRESGDAAAGRHPVYAARHSGQTRQKLSRSLLMRELDLALNMLREDLRRANR